MAPTLLNRLIKSMGFCCPFAFFRAVRGRSHGKVADRLGVSRQAIYYRRRQVKEHECVCEDRANCASRRFNGEIPRLPLTQIREGTSDPFV